MFVDSLCCVGRSSVAVFSCVTVPPVCFALTLVCAVLALAAVVVRVHCCSPLLAPGGGILLWKRKLWAAATALARRRPSLSIAST